MSNRLLILLVSLFVMSSCYETESLIESIAQSDFVECKNVGYAGVRSDVYAKYEKLSKKATQDELLQLLDHESPVVVVYSAYSLIDNKVINPEEVFRRVLQKDAVV
ncbi:hypothetical protein [Lewinella cohaerens]|uniref:hypothetical protein n=1 Tax=Lewinella cohaerens TaxID=70995 RepID=UPI0003780D92|nr:hypothetical protein [Lewinella cohaerens]